MEEGWFKFALGRAGRVVLLEDHAQLVHAVLPGRLQQTKLTPLFRGCFRRHTHPLFAGDGALPLHQVEALVGALGRPRHESLQTHNNQHRATIERVGHSRRDGPCATPCAPQRVERSRCPTFSLKFVRVQSWLSDTRSETRTRTQRPDLRPGGRKLLKVGAALVRQRLAGR